ncbi:class I SAM-dependent methyltransferase [Spongisporangium articulatum]|uniref:Class I SAM-dependent methyltransferase n=1 Tax=Spongisporangium articulatum TaxID=3362603 RepID=A0ABW8AJD7_9ACTN
MANGLPVRSPNDPAQYDDLTDEWWKPHGRFAALHWLAEARGALVPPPPYPGAPLLDVACGAGLLAPHLPPGWRHVGLDLSALSLVQARAHGVGPVRGDALRLPFADASLPCVVAGEVLEHLPDLEGACAELARVLAGGGVLVVDTLADTLFARLALLGVAEHVPGGPPAGLHRADLLVDPGRLTRALAAHGVHVRQLGGLRPSVPGYLLWLLRRRSSVRMLPTRSTAGVYQLIAVKEDT